MTTKSGCTKCGGIILADTEDWFSPLCHTCWQDQGEPEVEPKSEALEMTEIKRRLVNCPECKNVFGVESLTPEYASLLEKHERVLQMLEIAENALEFYADGKHLEEKDHEIIQVIPGNDEFVDHLVGLKAKEALAQIEGLK